MKVLSGEVRDGTIVVDGPLRLPDHTRVKLVVQPAGPQFDESHGVTQSAEETQLARTCRKRIGRITRKECR
jgi:hypothetical protein